MQHKLIIHLLPLMSDADGPSYSVVRLCQSLIKQGINLLLINCDCTRIKSVPTFLIRFPLGFGHKKLCRSPSMYNYLNQISKNKIPSLIHSHGLWTMPNIYSWWIGKKYNIPVIISPRGSLAKWAMNSGSLIKKIFWPLWQKPALIDAKCLHATSVAEFMDIRRLGFTQPVAIIPNGIDIPEYIPAKPQEIRTLLFLARINPIKGLDMLLPAWKSVQDRFPEWQLQIAGPDSRGYLHQVKQMVQKLELKRITFSGLITGKDKLLAYQNAELFILPSYTENFGMSIAEALASGTPVVTTKGTPWQSLIQHNAGWWVDLDINSIIKCLNEALSLKPEQLTAMGYNGRQLMIDEFSWEHIGSMMQQTYNWIINNTTAPECIHF